MTQEEKDLLIVDLCARLPYGIKGHLSGLDVRIDILGINGDDIFCMPLWGKQALTRDIRYVKPYLRPLSSMTEEEKRELQSFFPGSFGSQWLNLEEGYIDIYECESTTRLYLYDSRRLIEWLNKKMFDFRGLIPEGLAISTKEFNPYKD